MNTFSLKKVSYETKGQILVEVEPIRYRLEHLQYRTSRANTEKKLVVLARRILSNDIDEAPEESEWDTVTSIAAFNASYRFYWGQIAGLIKALPAEATTLSNPQQNKLNQQDGNKVFSSYILPVDFMEFKKIKLSRILTNHIFPNYNRKWSSFGEYLMNTTEDELLKSRLNYSQERVPT